MMTAPMAPRRASGRERKVTVCGKVPPPIAAALEKIAEQMSREAHPASVTISQLVEYALTDFVERRSRKAR